MDEKKIRMAIANSGVNCDADEIDRNATFSDIGLDSLDFYNIIISLQEMSGVEVPDDDIDQLQSIAAIENYFASE